jgi:hypothetical protein
MRIALALASVGMTALLAEFAVRAVMPAGRLLSPTAIEVFAERAARRRRRDWPTRWRRSTSGGRRTSAARWWRP